jgi:phosphatidylglycerophosphatase A
MYKKIMVYIATAGPFGYCPVASGSAGTMAAVPMAYVFCVLSWKWQLATLVALYFLFVHAASVAEEHFKEKDPGEVVCDEVIGYLVTMFALPHDAPHLALGYIFFRAFDVIKPGPIGWLDRRLPKGWGIVSDDVAAGILSQILLRIVL